MIVFLVQGRNRNTHERILNRPELCRVECHNYDWILRRKKIPPATYIFTDRERMDPWELRVIAALYEHLQQSGPGYRVVNDPARMKTRSHLLRALHDDGMNDFNAYAVGERVQPARFPVFLRREFDHALPVSDLLKNQSELDSALAKLRREREPEDGLLIIEYCAKPLAGELFRKLSAYRVCDRTFFYNAVHEHGWLVKYGTKNAATDNQYREEQQMIRDNAFSDVVGRAFDIAGVDYGRVDFGLVDGRPQIYEINSNPHIVPAENHPNPIRSDNQTRGWQTYCAAVNALDTTDRRGPTAQPFKAKGLERKRHKLRVLGRQRIVR